MASSQLAFALELADLADSLSLPRFRALDLRIGTKPDPLRSENENADDRVFADGDRHRAPS